MLKKRKVLLLGPISPPISGPGVKNKMLLEWLQKENIFQVKQLNTYNFRRLDIKNIFPSVINFLITKKIILSVSENGRFLFIPLCILLGKQVLLFPAGGSFDIEINNLSPLRRKVFLFFCRKIKATFIETVRLQKALEELGFKNVNFLPNPYINRGFKATVRVDNNDFKIVFVSKIREGKGVLLLVDAISRVKEKLKNIDIILDFYGIIDSGFNSQFVKKIEENSFSFYKGVCEPDQVQQTISKYDLFVLPTFFPEGVPGAVIEAMFTGIPIVISDYTAAQEMITNGVDGIVIPQNSIEPLVDAIVKIVLDCEFRFTVSRNILLKSKEYDYDSLMSVVKKYLIN